MYLAITPASSDRATPSLSIIDGVRLQRIAAVERAGRHGVDVLAHVELVDGVVAVLQADLGAERALAVLRLAGPGADISFAPLRSASVFAFEAVADHELLHLVDLGSGC